MLSAPGRCLIVKLNSDSSMRQQANFAFFTPLVEEEFKALTKTMLIAKGSEMMVS